jgi:hypothetical protein
MRIKQLSFAFVALLSLWVQEASGLSLIDISHSARSGETPSVAARRMEAQFAPWNNQQVTLRGFIYHSSDGRWILSSQPDLKTCCVGSPSKALSQVIVEGNSQFGATDRVIALRGTLQIRPEYDDDNALKALFYLTNAEIAAPPDDTSTFPLVLIFGIVCAIAVFLVSLRLIRKQSC